MCWSAPDRRTRARYPVETPAEIEKRWRYLRDLLIEQLERFEAGAYTLHADNHDVSTEAIAKLKRNILDFDQLIHRSEVRAAQVAEARRPKD